MKFVVSLVAVLGVSDALTLKLGEGETSTGGILETAGVNNDFSLVADEGNEDECFMQWVAANEKNYTSQEEMDEKKANWVANNSAIR